VRPVALEDQLVSIIVNYGLAGVVVYIFYMLFKNELSELRRSIERLNDRIDQLSQRIEKLIAIIERSEKK
jgi:predicted PurR-regulated permease PerM